nr:MAG TPA_asm: hypothetical protein [Caudoviricetes sp.]
MINYGMGNPYNNPMFNAQQRLNQLEQQYPQYVQTPIQQTKQQTLTIIPVTNKEEATAFMVDTLGTPTFFYNAGANEIYLKRTNLETGGADFVIFNKVVKPTTDFKKGINTYKEDLKALSDKIDGLYSLLGQPVEEQKVKGGKNAK